jgi:hypothetical protein
MIFFIAFYESYLFTGTAGYSLANTDAGPNSILGWKPKHILREEMERDLSARRRMIVLHEWLNL